MTRLIALFTSVLIIFDLSHQVKASRDGMRAAVPDHLLECYRNPQLVKNNLLPMTMPVLIDLIRKVETYQGMNMDMRVLATTLLQRFRLDGIERDPDVPANEYVLPYKTSGSEFYKFRFLMDSLIPNQQYTFPNASLNVVEQCTLHWMLSSSVEEWIRGDEGSTCNSLSNYNSWSSRIRRQVQQSPPAITVAPPSVPSVPPGIQRKTDPDAEILDSSAMLNDMSRKPNDGYQSYQPLFRGASVSDYSKSSCPIENGVVYTMYGAVRAGVVLAGIAAGLQPQTVSRRNLIAAMKFQGRPTIPSRSFGVDTDYSVNNKWAATLAGEVAEVAILQGPALGQSMRIGVNGGWNNTFVPRYYFLSEQSSNALSETDIRGGIDGLVIANNIVEWNRIANGGLKLSQLFEMYYSELGVFDVNYKACQRKSRFSQIAPTNNLLQEAANFAQVLQYEQPAAVNLELPAIQEFTRIAVSKLSSVVSSMNEHQCLDARQSGATATPAADIYVVIDCTWDFYSIEGVLSTLIQRCDVNPYGSQVTLINGKDGSVLVNTTQHISEFHQNFNFTYYNRYTRGFDMSRTLKELQVIFEIEINIKRQSTSGSYQQNKYYDDSYDSQSTYYGRARSSYASVSSPSELPKVVIFIPSLNVGSGSSDGDNNYIRNRISYFKSYLPDVKLLFLVSGSKERYTQYADNPSKDIFTLILSKDGTSSVEPLASRITEVPHPIANPTCGSSWVGRWYSTVQTTGYLQPNGIHYYRVHPNYFYKSTDARIRVQAQSSVTLTVCQSRSNPLPNGNRTLGGVGDVYCRQVSSDTYELKIGEDSCGDLYAFQCQPYYLSISVSQSQSSSSNNFMCREDDCRFPQMIKYTLSHEGLTCYSGTIKIVSSPVLIALLISILLKDNL